MTVKTMLMIGIALALMEGVTFVLVRWLRKSFQWLITPLDEKPFLNREGLAKFIAHGYDPELGWIRKPNTWHKEHGKHGETSYHIDARGARCHPGLERFETGIACFGDSFTFCRQVNDDETWPWYLSCKTGVGILNYGVGNYGVDQAYLRLEREIQGQTWPIVIMGVVPSTIVRILSVWKHYNEFGNTFGFKPRFDRNDDDLALIPNVMNAESKFYQYEKYLNIFRTQDYFYHRKFRKEMIRFPYLYSLLKNPDRNVLLILALLAGKLADAISIKSRKIREYPFMKIMHINKTLRYRLFSDEYAVSVFSGIIEKFAQLSVINEFKPIFLLLPQKDDVLFVRKKGFYYRSVIGKISGIVDVMDLTPYLMEESRLDDLYSEDNVYGGHFSKTGNQWIAEKIREQMEQRGYFRKELFRTEKGKQY